MKTIHPTYLCYTPFSSSSKSLITLVEFSVVSVCDVFTFLQTSNKTFQGTIQKGNQGCLKLGTNLTQIFEFHNAPLRSEGQQWKISQMIERKANWASKASDRNLLPVSGFLLWVLLVRRFKASVGRGPWQTAFHGPLLLWLACLWRGDLPWWLNGRVDDIETFLALLCHYRMKVIMGIGSGPLVASCQCWSLTSTHCVGFTCISDKLGFL